ncbi:6 TM domain-containing transmembrane protein [Acrasis kona]|uniref:6 TM domain-containing transmembrane protein n=1 Tax=Acrasis kona TaxID=1008807 RepID=A0AAW2ZDD1_9EUKA
MMSTANNTLPTTVPTKVVNGPGATTVTQTTVTQTAYATPVAANRQILSQIMGALMGLSMFIGGVLLLVGAAISLADFGYHYVASGVLWIIAFSFFTLASIFALISGFDLGNKNARTPYHFLNIIGSIAFFFGSVLMIIGAALWLAGTDRFNTFSAGTILWIIGSSLILAYFLIRNYGAIVDGIYLYHTYMGGLTNRTNGASTFEVAPKSLISSLYLNGIATVMYTVASVLLLLGSIAWTSFLRTFFSRSFQTEAGVLWVIAGSLYLIAGLIQIAARR